MDRGNNGTEAHPLSCSVGRRGGIPLWVSLYTALCARPRHCTVVPQVLLCIQALWAVMREVAMSTPMPTARDLRITRAVVEIHRNTNADVDSREVGEFCNLSIHKAAAQLRIAASKGLLRRMPSGERRRYRPTPKGTAQANPATPPSSIAANRQWLEEHSEQYMGRMVALSAGVLVDDDSDGEEAFLERRFQPGARTDILCLRVPDMTPEQPLSQASGS